MDSFLWCETGGGVDKTLPYLLTLHNCREHCDEMPVTDQDALMPELLPSFQLSPSDYFHHSKEGEVRGSFCR